MSMLGESKIAEADMVAEIAHAAVGQVRKYTGEPYIVHPRAVAAIVRQAQGLGSIPVIVALLHDVLEDTKLPNKFIQDRFGDNVLIGVEMLTNVPLSFGNRATRFKANVERLSVAPSWIKTIKCADLIDNTSTIVKHDPKFAPVYLNEKLITLEVLRGANQTIWQTAHDLCEEELHRINHEVGNVG